jgi:hypothetical protein
MQHPRVTIIAAVDVLWITFPRSRRWEKVDGSEDQGFKAQ